MKEIKSILFITLSNLGDIILTTPVLERLCDAFPEAGIDVITGSAGEELFVSHPAVRKITVNKKCQNLIRRLNQVIELRAEKYDVVVDLKNSLIPYLTGAKLYSRFLIPKICHKKEEHLSRLSCLGIDPFVNNHFFMPETKDEERDYIKGLIARRARRKIVIINPGAKSHLKRWPAYKYAELSDRLSREAGCYIFVVGSENDMETIEVFMSNKKETVVNLCRKTSIASLAELTRQASLVITNDSAPLHIASAVGTRTIAIFGPTDERKYGPLAQGSKVIKSDVSCRPCEKAQCARGIAQGCISDIEVNDVFQMAEKLLTDI
ncbi:MAG: lipopolysaccharide heptosyltransferase II [Candidatus Omnitrophota bacterium]